MAMSARWWWQKLGLGLALSAALAGCLCGGQTGQESCTSASDSAGLDDPKEDPQLDCAGVTTTVIAVDDRSALGWSAQETLDANTGPLRAPLRWYRLEQDTMVTVEARYTGGEVRAIQARALDVSAACNELQLEAELVIMTDDGRLDETIAVTLHSVGSDRLRTVLTVPLAGLNGSYDGSELDLSPFREPQLQLVVELVAGATHGMITLAGELADTSSDKTPTSAAVAGWP